MRISRKESQTKAENVFDQLGVVEDQL